MRPCGLRWTPFMIIMSTVGITRSDLEITAYYNWRYRTVYFHETDIKRFAECVCNSSAIKCNININYTARGNSYYTFEMPESSQQTGRYGYKKIFTCKFSSSIIITCLKNSQTNNYDGQTLIYIDDSSTCDLNCVGILWNKWEEASVAYNTENIINKGDLPANCLSTTIRTSKSSKITTTIGLTTTSATTKPTKLTTTLSTTEITFITFLNTTPEPPTSTVSFNNSGSNSNITGSSNNLNTTGIIVGIVVGFVVVLAIGVGTVIFIKRRRKDFKRTASSITVYANGNLNDFFPGANVSAYLELDNGNSGLDNETQYQYSEINSKLNSENEIGEYSNGKCFSQEDKETFSNSNIFPLVTSVSYIVPSNGVYSLASLSDSADASNSKYSSPNKHTENIKTIKCHQNISPHPSTEDIYSNHKKTEQDEDNVNQDSSTLNYLLANSILDKGSQNVMVAANVDTTTNVQTHTYATLGDQEKKFTHPYNCLSDSTKSSTVPTNDEHLPSSDTTDNQSTDYCVASSFSCADELSQPDSSTIGDDVITVSSDYDLARV